MNRSFAFSLMLVALTTGCATSAPAYEHFLDDQTAMIDDVSKVVAPWEVPPDGASRAPMKLPNIEAKFCLERAIDDVKKARTNTGWDTALIITGGVLVTGGTVTQAAAAALPANSNGTPASGKSALEVSGVSMLAGAAGVLALRTALQLSDVARTERIAAARNVDAAVSIFQYYAISDDPTELGADAFATCRDGDIDIAGSFPGSKTSDATQQKLTDSATQKKADQKTAVDTATTAQTAKSNLAKARSDAVADMSATITSTLATAAASPKATAIAPLLAQAKQAHADALAEVQKHSALRAAAAAAPPDQAAAKQEEASKQADVAASALKDAGAKTKAAAEAAAAAPAKPGAAPADPNAKNAAAAVDKATTAATATQQLSAADAQAAKANQEAAQKTAEATVATKRLELFQAASRWRRAVFFQTAADRRLAGDQVVSAKTELDASIKALSDLAAAPPPAAAPPGAAPPAAPPPAAAPPGAAPPGAQTPH